MSNTDDALFSTITRWQGDRPWGSLLDAGTGLHSLSWVSSLETTRWTAITGSRQRALSLEKRHPGRPVDAVRVGNWKDPLLCHGETYDTVLADYLLGALEGFSPYFQDRLFRRLRPHVAQRLYVVGLAPYEVDAVSQGQRLIEQIVRLRDATLQLAGVRPYREYPLEWVTRSLEESGFEVLEAQRFPIRYKLAFAESQISVARTRLRGIADAHLRASVEASLDELLAASKACTELTKGVAYGEDWVVAARPA